ncbi:MAG: signal transduction histidine kinase/Na+/proline symporter [Candidatus Azotimanducaceae bacterium]|jgi:signal transduction histidine kinase/Na+/proline symporter
MFSLAQLFFTGIVYLTILFGTAFATEKGWLPLSLTQHPATRILALGVFAGAICFNGALGLAATHGSGYLLYFLGASAAFIIAPVLLNPLSRIALTHRLGSLADVFAFRYPAPWVGGLVSLLMLVGLLPLIALQIHAVSVIVHLLNQQLSEALIAIGFCITMTAFAILFGARHLSTRDKHQGLVVALGLESIIKLVAFMALALYCVISVFGGFAGMNTWFMAHHTELSQAQTQLDQGGSRSLLLVFFAATVAMPHLYHILLTENDDATSLRSARWGFPLYMLLVSLCIPPIVWAASLLDVGTPPEFFAVGIGLTLDNRTVAMLAFIASVAAASGVLIVSTLALSSMTLNHLILPVYRPGWGGDIYAKLLTTRRLLIAGIILASYGIYRLLATDQTLISLGVVAFVAVLQFLPGLLGTFYWRRANKSGLLAGLLAGFGVWFLMLFYPLIDPVMYGSNLTYPIAAFDGAGLPPLDHQIWHLAILGSLAVNSALFIFFSWLYEPSVDEARAADTCMSNSFARPFQGTLQARSVAEIETSLALVLGETAARHEVNLALTELRLPKDEQRSHALSQIRKKIETNLSSTLGQTIAHRIIGRFIPFESSTQLPTFESVLSIETRMEDFRSQMTGLAAELDGLRRYHRQILQDLPTAVCSIGLDQSVLIWNRAMERLTEVSAEGTIGTSLKSLSGEWFILLNEFAADDTTHQLKTDVVVNNRLFLLNLHKASIDSVPAAQGDVVIVIEDITEEQILEEQLLHNERLASIGQLAAGVAHEVGNPITGIACLAQNLLMETSDPELQDLGHQILDQTKRVSHILQSLVNFAHSGKSDLHRPREPVDIRQCIDEALSLLSLNHASHDIGFTVNFPLETYVIGDAQRLSQVFVNILSNARDASKPGDVVTISVYQQDSTVNITIADQGHGVSSGNLNRMFEPFFTTKDPGQGTGLGLAITTTIIEEHHGVITASSAGDGLGTHIKITLPLYLSSEIQLTSTDHS